MPIDIFIVGTSQPVKNAAQWTIGVCCQLRDENLFISPSRVRMTFKPGAGRTEWAKPFSAAIRSFCHILRTSWAPHGIRALRASLELVVGKWSVERFRCRHSVFGYVVPERAVRNRLALALKRRARASSSHRRLDCQTDGAERRE